MNIFFSCGKTVTAWFSSGDKYLSLSKKHTVTVKELIAFPLIRYQIRNGYHPCLLWPQTIS